MILILALKFCVKWTWKLISHRKSQLPVSHSTGGQRENSKVALQINSVTRMRGQQEGSCHPPSPHCTMGCWKAVGEGGYHHSLGTKSPCFPPKKNWKQGTWAGFFPEHKIQPCTFTLVWKKTRMVVWGSTSRDPCGRLLGKRRREEMTDGTILHGLVVRQRCPCRAWGRGRTWCRASRGNSAP